jgi:probable rRNA maturation factor
VPLTSAGRSPVLDVEVFGAETLGDGAPAPVEIRRLCVLAAAAAGVQDGHVAIEFVGSGRIARLNAEYRGRAAPTDVLSFPIDGVGGTGGTDGTGGADWKGGADGDWRDFDGPLGGVPRELGDVVICPEHTEDLREAVVHGVLHLVGMDHELDDGEMLALQAELLRWERL